MTTLFEKQKLQYAKVNQFAVTRKKVLRFAIPEKLDHKEKLQKEIEFLKRQNWEVLQPKGSELCNEDSHRIEPKWACDPTEDEFWSILFSSEWSGTLRLCYGGLLDSFLSVLNAMSFDGNVQVYRTAKFDEVERCERIGSLKPVKRVEYRKVPVKIVYSYFYLTTCRETKPTRTDRPWEEVIKMSKSAYVIDKKSKFKHGKKSKEPCENKLDVIKPNSRTKSPKRIIGEPDRITALHAQRRDAAGTQWLTADLMLSKRLSPSESIHEFVHFETDQENEGDFAMPEEMEEYFWGKSITPFFRGSDYLKEKEDAKRLVEESWFKDRPRLTDKREYLVINDTDNKEFKKSSNKLVQNKHTSLTLALRHRKQRKEQQIKKKEKEQTQKGVFIQDNHEPEGLFVKKRRDTMHTKATEKTKKSKSVNNYLPSLQTGITNNNKDDRKTIFSQSTQDDYTEIDEDDTYDDDDDTEDEISWKDSLIEMQPNAPSLIRAIIEKKNERPFIPLNAKKLRRNISIERIRKIKRQRRIQKGLRPSKSPTRELISNKLQSFLEGSYLPRLEKVREQGATVYKTKYKLSPRLTENNKIQSNSPFLNEEALKKYDDYSLPKSIDYKQWRKLVEKAVGQFIVRKEQITFANGLKTKTSLTFTRDNNSNDKETS